MWLTDNLPLEIIAPALVIGVMISLVNGPLGIEVLRRGVIFIDLAVAHIAGFFLIAGSVFFHDLTPMSLQLLTLLCVIVVCAVFWHLEKKIPERIEALIGTCFIVAASSTFLLLDDHPHAGDLIKALLSGQILFTTWKDVVFHTPIFGLLLTGILFRPLANNGFIFYVLFALAITFSVRLVGVYIVFASLIIPALISENSKHPNKSVWILGIVSVIIGITLGVLTDKPVGPLIVLAYVITSLTTKLLTDSQIKSKGEQTHTRPSDK